MNDNETQLEIIKTGYRCRSTQPAALGEVLQFAILIHVHYFSIKENNKKLFFMKSNLLFISLFSILLPFFFVCSQAEADTRYTKKEAVSRLIYRNKQISMLDSEINHSYRLALKTAKNSKNVASFHLANVKYRYQCKSERCIYWSYLTEQEHLRDFSELRKYDFNCGSIGHICDNYDNQLVLDEYRVAFNYVSSYAKSWSSFAEHHLLWRNSIKDMCMEPDCFINALQDRIKVLWNTPLDTPMPPSERGTYSISSGSDFMCLAMTDNLNRFSYPMRCGLQVHPNYTDMFLMPNYKDIDPKDAANENLLIKYFSNNSTGMWYVKENSINSATRALKDLQLLQHSHPGLGDKFGAFLASSDDESDDFYVLTAYRQFCQADNPAVLFFSENIFLDKNLNVYDKDSNGKIPSAIGTIFSYDKKYYIFSPTGLDYVIRKIHRSNEGVVTSMGEPICYIKYSADPKMH